MKILQVLKKILFGKKGKTNIDNKLNFDIDVDNLYVVTTEIISNYNDGSGGGLRAPINCFLLAKCENEEYYECFSNVKLEKNRSFFNTPSITKIEPIQDYLKNKNETSLTKEILFSFIVELNVYNLIKNK